MDETWNENILLNINNEDGKNNNTNHYWAKRAVDEGQTKLTEEELS